MNPLLIRRRGMMQAATPPSTLVFHNYLVYDGAAYIQTDILLPQNGAVKTYVKLGNLRRAEGYFSALDNSANIVFGVRSTSFTNFVGEAFYDSTSYSRRTGGINWANHSNANMWITPSAFSAADTTLTFTKGSTLPTSGLIFGQAKSSNPFRGQMAVIYIYDDSAQNVTNLAGFTGLVPLYTLKPCEYNNQCGLWCEETNRFYGNTAGVGTLNIAD